MLQPVSPMTDQSHSVPKDGSLATLSIVFAALYLICVFGSCCSGGVLSFQGFRRENPLWPEGSSLRSVEDIGGASWLFMVTGGPLAFFVIALTYAGIGIAFLCWSFSPHSHRNVFSTAENRRSWFVALGALFLFAASMVMFGVAHYRIYHPFNGIRPDVIPFRDDSFTANFILTLTILGFIVFVAGGLLALFSIINLFVAMQRPRGWPR